jgi:hypothetical protein
MITQEVQLKAYKAAVEAVGQPHKVLKAHVVHAMAEVDATIKAAREAKRRKAIEAKAAKAAKQAAKDEAVRNAREKAAYDKAAKAAAAKAAKEKALADREARAANRAAGAHGNTVADVSPGEGDGSDGGTTVGEGDGSGGSTTLNEAGGEAWEVTKNDFVQVMDAMRTEATTPVVAGACHGGGVGGEGGESGREGEGSDGGGDHVGVDVGAPVRITGRVLMPRSGGKATVEVALPPKRTNGLMGSPLASGKRPREDPLNHAVSAVTPVRIDVDIPSFTLADVYLSRLHVIREWDGHQQVDYGVDVVLLGENEEVLALYISDALQDASPTLLSLLKDIYKDGKGVPRAQSKLIADARSKMVMGGFREVLGNRPELVFGWYNQYDDVVAKQQELADGFYSALQAHEVLKHVGRRFKQVGTHFLKHTHGYGLIPFTAVTTISTTLDYQSAWHVDSDGPAGSVIGWIDDGEVQGDGYFSAPFVMGVDKDATKTVTLRPKSGSVLWLDSDKVYHKSGAPQLYTPLDTRTVGGCHRYGFAMACKPHVLNLAIKRLRQVKQVLVAKKAQGTYGA